MTEFVPATVLVVEDEVLIRMDLVDALTEAGYLTMEAGNSADAIDLLELHPEIRVVFTDIQMPGDMDGLQLSHYVRNRWPPTIIVVCSANELPSPEVLPERATFIGKPYDAAKLKKMLDKVTEQLAA